MTYDTSEVSVDSGEPYFIYLFDNGVGDLTRLTSEPVTLTRLGETWLPSSISHSEIEKTGNIEKQEFKLVFPLSDIFARTFLATSNNITTFTAWRGHRNDVSEELKVYYKGRVVGAHDRTRTIEVKIESIFTSMRRPGLRARWQRPCRWVLYRDGCNLTRSDFEVASTVTAIVGFVLTVPEAAGAISAPVDAGDYIGGIVNFGGQLGFVENHVGDQVTLTSSILGLADEVSAEGSAAILISPGCNLSLARCTDRFANDINHGGFPYLPSKNPFDVRIG